MSEKKCANLEKKTGRIYDSMCHALYSAFLTHRVFYLWCVKSTCNSHINEKILIKCSLSFFLSLVCTKVLLFFLEILFAPYKSFFPIQRASDTCSGIYSKTVGN